MSSKNPLLIPSLLTEKCPKCRRGNIFTQKSIFPLNTCLQVNEYCGHCNQKIKVENNYGQGMNFVFIVIVFIVTAIIYSLTLGLSFKDNSIFYYLGVGIILSLLLQPWLMRLSRVLFLYLVIPFDKTK
ncbi:DUF983 domain-containing protein [Taibaiella lutea]|uniref:DUF983 domain-containing protein n=1 Tax=Taibaiella lutea TaxID=2608001 RepID=A0A5M6CJV1_9BACT|nr:DUF983 domain-containing protein [Taibaiella lutea]KAA5533389.1 DUF983 domain-containing protein [Taibaiella lutea]